MTGDVQRANPDAQSRILLLGRSQLVLESVMAELIELGLTVEGTTRLDQAAMTFDAANFDLIAIGGGIADDVRADLKQAFAAQNREVRLLDASVPNAVAQVLAALNGDGAAERVDLDAYFTRIGYDGPRTPTLETLRALHALHPDAIVFEAFDVLLDRGVDLAPQAVDAKLIGAQRGGYCFEQNGLFKRVLEAIGFQVQGLAARVNWGKAAGTPVSPRTHMALKVTIDGMPWLADVGFGSCVQTEPLRMDAVDPQPTQHEAFRVFPYGPSLLLQIRRDDRWLPVYELTPEAQFEPDYELANWFTATHPASHFRQHLIAARTTPEARYALLDNRFTIRRPDGAVDRQRLDAAQIEHLLADVFRLPVAADWRPVIERAAKPISPPAVGT